jgi:hypothetical protein
MKLAVGDLVMHRDSPQSTGEFGVIRRSNKGTALVHFKNREIYIRAAALAPIATAQFALDSQREKTDMSRLDQSPSHFISIEIPATGPLAAEVKRYQEWVQEGAGDVIIGKAQKLTALHITLGVLPVLDDELETVKKAIRKAFDKFKDGLLFEQGFLLNFRSLGFLGESGSLFMKPAIGAESLRNLRGCLEDELSAFLTERECNLHLTIFRKMTLDEDKMRALLNTGCNWRTSGFSAEILTLRQMKAPGIDLMNILTCSLSCDKLAPSSG